MLAYESPRRVLEAISGRNAVWTKGTGVTSVTLRTFIHRIIMSSRSEKWSPRLSLVTFFSNLLQNFLDRHLLENSLRLTHVLCLLDGARGDDDLASVVVVDLDVQRCDLFDEQVCRISRTLAVSALRIHWHSHELARALARHVLGPSSAS